MKTMLRFLIIVCLVVLVNAPLYAGVPTGPNPLLDVNFDNRTPATLLGTGGAAAGEPTALNGLSGLIVESAPGSNFLRVSNNTIDGLSARSLYWDLADDLELTSGMVRVSFRMTPSALDRYSFGIRENGGSSKSFLTATLTTSGTISVSDAAGAITLSNNTYSANTELAIVIEFDMDAGTSQMTINDVVLFSGRSHGIVDRGVGRLLTGYSTSNNQTPFDLDDLLVLADGALPLILDADFNDKTVGQPIGTGGAEAEEPVNITAGITTQIIDPSASNPKLRLQNSAGNTTRAMVWRFLDYLEVPEGTIALDMDIEFSTEDDYEVTIRESGSITRNFASLRFTAGANLLLTDEAGIVSIPLTSYSDDQVYRLQFIFDMDNRTYTVIFDNTELVADRAHGITDRGVGSILFVFHDTADATAEIVIDDLQAGASAAPKLPSQLTFVVEPTSGFVNQALVPAPELEVVNVYDQPVPNGTIVTMSIQSGPGGASLDGTIAEATVAGSAQFDNLKADTVGVYRLRALSGDARVVSLVDLVVTPPILVYKDGFEGNP
jgi:hypothetical protein